jgi:hypothetical protein
MPLSVSRTRMTRRTSGRLVLALDGVRLRGWIVVLWVAANFLVFQTFPALLKASPRDRCSSAIRVWACSQRCS